MEKHAKQQTLTLQDGVLTDEQGISLDLTLTMACLNFLHRKTNSPIHLVALQDLQGLTGIRQEPSGNFVAIESGSYPEKPLDRVMDRVLNWPW